MHRLKFNLPKETLYILYNSIVLPLLDYGDIVYGNCSAITLKRLQLLQNRGTRMLLNYGYRTHSVNMFSELEWLNIKDRLHLYKMCLVYKCRNGLVPQYLAETFSNVSWSMNIIFIIIIIIYYYYYYHTRAKTHQT